MAALDSDVPVLDCNVDHEDLEMGCYKVLEQIRTTWKKENIRREYIDQNSAHANRTFVCHDKDNYDDAVVFRVHTDRLQQFVNSDVSLKSFLLFNEIGVAPKLICRLKNGICCEFVKGETFSIDGNQDVLKDVSIAKNVAKALAKIHAKRTTVLAREKYDMNEENTPWTIFDLCLDGWRDSLNDPECQALFTTDFPTKDDFLHEKVAIEKMLEYENFSFGFCHNDSGFGNVIYNKEKDYAVLIDYDVCGFNYHLLDLAQYTVSAAIGYPNPAGEERIYSFLPEEDLRLICRSYLEKLLDVDGWNRDVTDIDVERLYAQLTKISMYFILYRVSASVLLASFPKVGPNTRPVNYLRSGLGLWNWYKREKEAIFALKVPDVPPTD